VFSRQVRRLAAAQRKPFASDTALLWESIRNPTPEEAIGTLWTSLKAKWH
jgi:hypothetical protein